MSDTKRRPVIDLHGDLYAHFAKERMGGSVDVFKKYHLENFTKGQVKFAVFNIWLDDESVPPKQRAMEILKNSAIEVTLNRDVLNQVYSKSDFLSLSETKVNFMLGLEGLDFLDEACEIYLMYAHGVRLISLTWNHNNAFGSSYMAGVENGLSCEGRKAVSIMNDLGIVIDISHLNDVGAKEVLELSTAPVIASHSNVRTIASHKRNLSDELITLIANSGGVIGMNAYPTFVCNDAKQADIDELIEHIIYIKQLVGIEYVALGFDFMDYLADDALESFIEGSPYMEELKNQSHIQILLDRLSQRGFTDREVEMIAYANAARVIESVLK